VTRIHSPARLLWSGTLVTAMLAGLLAAEPIGAAPKNDKSSASVVKVTATADKPDADGKQIVTITLAMDKDWHTYANPVGNEDLETTQTVVTIGAKVKPTEVKIDYPKGKLIKDSVLGNYSIYEDKVTIKATVRRAKGDTSPLEVSVKISACIDTPKLKKCLMPATVKVSVP
jgi:hypothetical protein